MTVTYDLSTLVGQVRLLIGDTVLTDTVFTDEEITYFLTANGNNVNLAAATALEAWAASYGANADSEKIGDYNYTQSIIDKLLAMAQRLRALVADIPAMDWAEMNLTNVLTEETD